MENRITNFASTILSVMGKERENHMDCPFEIANEILKSGVREKCLIVSVDAVPKYLTEQRADLFEKVIKHAPNTVELITVMPSVTPVCYGAMFSGTTPDKNGIPCYVEPMVTSEIIQPTLSVTPFTQTLVKNGKKVAVVTCNNGCIKSMLYGRDADLYIVDGDDDKKMAQTAYDLLDGDYDVVFLYQLDYDYTQHKVSPTGEKAITKLKEKVEVFDWLCKKATKVWEDKKYMLVFNSDHGCHEVEGKKGAHGENCADDMQLKYYFGWNK